MASLLILAFIGLFLLHRQRLFAMVLLIFSLSALLLLSLPISIRYLANTQEIYPPLTIEKISRFSAQAIVILGGGLSKPAPEYAQAATLKTNSLARVRYGAFLAKKNQLPVLVSDGKVLAAKLPSEAEVMSEVLNNEFNQAVDWQEHRSRNTAENALYTWEILAKENIQRIILVTHALHMQRAVDQFVQQGFKVLPAPTMFLSRSDELDLLSFIPSAQALQRNTLVIHEMMGRLWYKLRY
ncbi:MAG: YdcF family protein [Methyloprofundus sp.]|nr:YdcF family protein [Methyloprofundus sp.]